MQLASKTTQLVSAISNKKMNSDGAIYILMKLLLEGTKFKKRCGLQRVVKCWNTSRLQVERHRDF